MTDELDALEDRQLDVAVAEKIFDISGECTLIGEGNQEDPMRLDNPDALWRRRSPKDGYWDRWSPNGDEVVINHCFHYTHFLDSANLILDHLGEDDWEYSIQSSRDCVQVRIWKMSLNGVPTQALGFSKQPRKNLARAICLAALRATQHKETKS